MESKYDLSGSELPTAVGVPPTARASGSFNNTVGGTPTAAQSTEDLCAHQIIAFLFNLKMFP